MKKVFKDKRVNKSFLFALSAFILLGTVPVSDVFASETKTGFGNEMAKIEGEQQQDLLGARTFLSYPTFRQPYEGDTEITGVGKNGATVYVQVDYTKYSAKVVNGRYTVRLPKPLKYYQLVSAKQYCFFSSGTIKAYVWKRPIVKPSAPTLNQVTDLDQKITGRGQVNSAVVISIGGDTYKSWPDRFGDFSVLMNKTYPAGTKIEAYAILPTGERSDYTIGYVIGTEKIGITLDDFTSQDILLSGKTSLPNATFAVTIGFDSFSGKSDSLGNFTIATRRMYDAGTDIVYKASTNNSSSEEKRTKVLPKKVTINVAYAGAQSVSGSADRYSTVILKISNPRTGTVKSYQSQSNWLGDYTISLPQPLVFGDTIESYQIYNGIESAHSTLNILTRPAGK